jgi:hypothetical protein
MSSVSKTEEKGGIQPMKYLKVYMYDGLSLCLVELIKNSNMDYLYPPGNSCWLGSSNSILESRLRTIHLLIEKNFKPQPYVRIAGP